MFTGGFALSANLACLEGESSDHVIPSAYPRPDSPLPLKMSYREHQLRRPEHRHREQHDPLSIITRERMATIREHLRP